MTGRTLRWRLALAVLVFAACSHSPEHEPAPPAGQVASERPALVAMLVVDQLSQELLDRYDDAFTGGFRRVIDGGRWYVNATHDHAGTSTAPGHATLSTGTYPSRHGIVANEWFEKVDGEWIEISNVGDSTVQIVGYPEIEGVSPHSLELSGLADWILAAEPGAKVASVSPKDRGAVLPAAHTRGQVWWFESSVGRFVTSTYYRDGNPEWIDRFHDEVLTSLAADSVWTSRVPMAFVGLSDPDTADYEGDNAGPVFPHRFAGPGERTHFWEWFERTPMLDEATLELARIVVSEEEMGRDSIPDFLGVSLSQTDRVGHDFGPLSREQLDNLLRLDAELGAFFAFLDSVVGPGRWVLGMSGDHGVLVTGHEMRVGEEAAARRWTPEEKAALDEIRAGAEEAEEGIAPADVAAALEELDYVAEAWTHEELTSGAPADSFAELERNSLYPGRAREEVSRWGVEVRFDPYFLDRDLGSGHGTPYWYDRHVPVLFYGPGVPQGRDSTRVATVDFAPTLARMLDIQFPEDLDGAPLRGVVGQGD